MKIAIIGCGYVGMAFAKKEQNKGYTITATTSYLPQVKELSALTQKAIYLKDAQINILEEIIKDNEAIIISIRAKSFSDYEPAYLHFAEAIKTIARKLKTPKQIIFLSSGLLYGEHEGKWVDENSPLHNTSQEAAILRETENNYLSLLDHKWKVCIFRMGKIYGPSREIGDFFHFGNEQVLTNPDVYTNFIYIDDIVNAISFALKHSLSGIYNLCDDDHPTRKDLFERYQTHYKSKKIEWKAAFKGFEEGNKRISNHKIKKEGFTFAYPEHVIH